MARVSAREFQFDVRRLHLYCGVLTRATRSEASVDSASAARRAIDFFDRCIEAGAPWEGFADAFPGASPRAVRVALELRRWWPTPHQQTILLRLDRGVMSLADFSQDWAALLSQAVVHAEDLSAIHAAVADIRRDARTRLMPWKILEPITALPWPSVSISHPRDVPGQIRTYVPDRMHPDEVQTLPSAMKKLTELRDAIREAQRLADEAYADDSSLACMAAAEVLNPLRDARESIDASHDSLGEWHANRPPKAAHQHELYARIAVGLARSIQGFIRPPRARAINEGDRATTSQHPAGDAPGIDKISLAGADRLMQALYGVPMSSRYLASKIQDWQDTQLRDRRTSRHRPDLRSR
jgi:hypothetical protein